MLKWIVCAVLFLVWIYVLRTLDRAKLEFWHFLVGAFGLFLFMMVLIRPVATDPLAKAVAAMAGLVGTLTKTFTPYFRYGILFITSEYGSITLQIDFECSGIVEIMAYLALLVFFRVYNKQERVALAILGTLLIMVANALRIIVICECIHFLGPDIYYLAHTVLGRIVFYFFSVALYFYVFTKPQIVRMKVGRFSYEHN